MSIKEIKNFRIVNNNIATGGQPTKKQIKALADQGYERIVNLAKGNEVKFDETEAVADLGLDYNPIPVEWSAPSRDDLIRFFDVLDESAEQRVFIHCAANYRVTGFYGLYGAAKLGWTSEQVESFISETWNPDEFPVWRTFIDEMIREFSG